MLLALIAASAATVTAQDYPQRPIRMIVPFGAGGVSDAAARIIGQTQVMFASMPSAINQVRAGKVRAIAVTSRQRFPATPDLPTAIESGYPGFEIVIWNAAMAPAGTPQDILDKLNAAILEALKLPDVKTSFDNLGMELTPGSAAQLASYIKSELAKFARVVKESGARIE